MKSEEQGNTGGGHAVQSLRLERSTTPPREALQSTIQELNFMKMLVPFVPTPRSAKRLANIYRLMRVLVTADEAASFRPGHEDTGHYKIALTLLAILVGFPNQAALMFRQLLKAEDTSWSAFHARLAAGCAETHHAAADGQAELKRSRQKDKTTTPRQPTGRYECDREQPDHDESGGWGTPPSILGRADGRG